VRSREERQRESKRKWKQRNASESKLAKLAQAEAAARLKNEYLQKENERLKVSQNTNMAIVGY
jgi:hypothetical protein